MAAPISEKPGNMQFRYNGQILNWKKDMMVLSMADLLLLQCRKENTKVWVKAFAKRAEGVSCEICQTNSMGMPQIKQHIPGRNHQRNVETIVEFRHHSIESVAPAKNQSETRQKPAISANELESIKTSLKLAFDEIKQFKLKHVHLEIDELLKVEYRDGNSNIWYSLVHSKGNTFKCNLCNTPYLGHVKNIIEHIRSRRHFTAAQSLGEIYHPKICSAAYRMMTEPHTSNKSPVKPVPAIDNSKPPEEKAPLVNTVPVNSMPNKESEIPPRQSKNTTVAKNIPVQTPADEKNVESQIPRQTELPNNPQSNVPSFATKPFTTKPETDADIEGLIGVEYVVKILRNAADHWPRLECCLCELETDGSGVQDHLKSATHRMKYLNRHFPSCMRQLQTVRTDPSARTMMVEILQSISVAIEKHYGRGVSFECLQDELVWNRQAIKSKVFSFQHVSEYSGPSFVNVVEKYILEKGAENKDTCDKLEPKRKPPFDAADQVSVKCSRGEDQQPFVNTSSLDVEEHKKLVDRFLTSTNRDGLPDRTQRGSKSRSCDRRHISDPSRSQSVGPRHSVRDVDSDYKRFERDSQYRKEWIISWQKRSDELANEKRKCSSGVGEKKTKSLENNNTKTTTQLFCDMLALDMRKLSDSSQRRLRIQILELLDNHITTANMITK